VANAMTGTRLPASVERDALCYRMCRKSFFLAPGTFRRGTMLVNFTDNMCGRRRRSIKTRSVVRNVRATRFRSRRKPPPGGVPEETGRGRSPPKGRAGANEVYGVDVKKNFCPGCCERREPT